MQHLPDSLAWPQSHKLKYHNSQLGLGSWIGLAYIPRAKPPGMKNLGSDSLTESIALVSLQLPECKCLNETSIYLGSDLNAGSYIVELKEGM